MAQLSYDLSVADEEVFKHIAVGKNANLNSNFTFSETFLSSDLDVAKTVVLSSDLSITGKAILSSHLSVGEKAILNTLKTSGATTLQTTLKLVGAGTLDSTLAITSATTLSETLSVGGTTKLNTLDVGNIYCRNNIESIKMQQLWHKHCQLLVILNFHH